MEIQQKIIAIHNDQPEARKTKEVQAPAEIQNQNQDQDQDQNQNQKEEKEEKPESKEKEALSERLAAIRRRIDKITKAKS